ncbi:39S ribosomal protein L24, mitochondrial [Cadophora gregata]|uniref:39S ribosomal protein L24, mitochondrial n=1 Tax=Cadophora gregata TaxID=51156 RepID=UPI0026DDB005|nr:39S ribosomal protein L24, mitochondrial [Cadophora gregata]KAK0100833.1 39S ribosomal protein L24, mitochondrial [Cadophora gregata]KAK0117174.1 39S ribosomal protein L24, mitochondrial [Cadophora gregata f. sp. sojae]
MPLFKSSHPSLTHLRSFTCTARTLANRSNKRLEGEHSVVPPYPYGPSLFYKQSNNGLYGTQKIRFGNIVSEKNEIKTRRYWRPNVHFKRLWSDALQDYIRLRITTRVLRTVDKVGGLDEYLLGEKAGRLKELGIGGWKLRWRIMQTDRVKERFRRQRELLGLPPKEDDLVTSDGQAATPQQVAQEMEAFDADLKKGQEVEVGENMEAGEAEPGFMHEQPPKQEKVVL